MGGADQISVHLRRDRQHIQERDVNMLKKIIRTRLNLHITPAEEMVAIVLAINPDIVTLVPEKNNEIKLENGLDIVQHNETISSCLKTLRGNRVISLFIDPDLDQIKAAHKLGVDAVALNATHYAGSFTRDEYANELERLANAASLAFRLGLQVMVKNDIDYQNVQNIINLSDMQDIIVGHSIVARAMLVGMERAVQELAKWIRRL